MGRLFDHLVGAPSVFCSGKLPSPRSEPEWVFASSQPAVTNKILGIERRRFTASLRGARSSRERRAHAGVDIVITERLLQSSKGGLASTMTGRDVLHFERLLERPHDFGDGVIGRDNQM